jgi:hypothetical protein
MFNANDTLRRLGFPEEQIPEMSLEFGMSYARMPESLEALDEGFLRESCVFCRLDDEAAAEVLQGAALIRKDPDLTAFLWHVIFTLLYWRTMYHSFPMPEKAMGDLAGTFYLIVHLYARTAAKERYLAKGYPPDIVQDTLALPDSVTEYRKKTGHAGTGPQGVAWIRRYLTCECFRLGRFEYFIANVANQPTVLENLRSGERLILQEDRSEGGCFIGKTVRQKEGILDGEERSFPEKEWKKILCQGDCVLSMHIPAGGGMTPERSLDSFRRAFAFFGRRFPGKFHPAIVCKSWIGNPQFLALLPESNIAKLMRNARLFPLPSSGIDGMHFIFGWDTIRKYGTDYARYPHDNSVRRAMLSVLERGDSLRLGGMLFFEDELKNFIL